MLFGRRRDRDFEYSDYYEEGDRIDRAEGPRRKIQVKMLPHLIVLALLTAIFLAVIWGVAGRVMFEKTMQALVTPVGLSWLGLFAIFYFSALNRVRDPAVISLVCWILLTIGGNSFIVSKLIGTLESPYQNSSEFAEVPQLDVALVLGGGISTNQHGAVQLGNNGDRILQAARLYKLGKVKTIVCGGTHGLPPSGNEFTQAEGAVKLLVSLGVPESDLHQIDGANTLQEVQALDRWLAGKPERTQLKIGILTSAWHMKRATRLANSVGIDATPVPVDFRSLPFKREPGLIVPSAANLRLSHLAIKEYLAGMLGR